MRARMQIVTKTFRPSCFDYHLLMFQYQYAIVTFRPAARAPARPLPAGQAIALAGWPRACIQSISEFWIMHA